MQENLKLFVPIQKIDEAKRQVWGVLAQEQTDRVGEIFDYESSKPYFEAWSDGFRKVTGGKSLGNLRAMHGMVAAGKFIHVEFDDAGRKINVGAEVVDEAEWQKCLKAVYTGFSIGAYSVKTWPDDTNPGLTRYTANPVEGSIVDYPCIPGAVFNAVKADGSIEVRKLVGRQVRQVWSCGYDGCQHDQKAEALKCSGPDLSKALEPCKPVFKGLYDVADLACALAALNYIRQSAEFERESEQDGSSVPDLLEECVRMVSEALVQMVEEETAELVADPDDSAGGPGAVMQAAKPDIAKRIEITDEMSVALADTLERLKSALAPNTGDSNMKPEEIEKLVGEVTEKATAGAVLKMKADFDTFNVSYVEGRKLDAADREATNAAIAELTSQVKDVVGAFKALSEHVKSLPAPAKGIARPVAKIDDGAPADETPADKTSVHDLIKASFRTPINVLASA